MSKYNDKLSDLEIYTGGRHTIFLAHLGIINAFSVKKVYTSQ